VQIRRCGLPRQIEVRSDNHFLRAVALDAFDELSDLELIGSNAFDGRNSTVQDVIAALELTSALERKHI
jgi:hypothetical protein